MNLSGWFLLSTDVAAGSLAIDLRGEGIELEKKVTMTTIKRILCPIDFSEASQHALEHAVAIAHWYNASVSGASRV